MTHLSRYLDLLYSFELPYTTLSRAGTITLARSLGVRLSVLATAFGISRERVRQIAARRDRMIAARHKRRQAFALRAAATSLVRHRED